MKISNTIIVRGKFIVFFFPDCKSCKQPNKKGPFGSHENPVGRKLLTLFNLLLTIHLPNGGDNSTIVNWHHG
jgi:hypothetical protein